MKAKAAGLGIIHKILIVFIILNIIGDIANIAFWYAIPSSRGSLLDGYIGNAAGAAGANTALAAGSIVLAVVSIVYIAAVFGLFKKMKWVPLLVIAISVANRALALVLYPISFALVFWAIWTIILVVLAYLDYRKMKTLA
jgi:uncharacterized membrane protein